MIKLGVNIDHVATVRQARYRDLESGEPDPVAAALLCEEAGAHGITAHLREDRRHIQDRDMSELRERIRTRLNFEMANTPEIVEIALATKPDIVCLVPESREEVTTEGGLDVVGSLESQGETCRRMTDAGIEVSLFIDPELSQVEGASKAGSPFIELHTGAYAEAFHDEAARAHELDRLASAAQAAHELGIRVNAGHGLNYENVTTLMDHVPGLVELNIGHSIVSRAIAIGITTAVKDMLALLSR